MNHCLTLMVKEIYMRMWSPENPFIPNNFSFCYNFFEFCIWIELLIKYEIIDVKSDRQPKFMGTFKDLPSKIHGWP